MAVPSEASFLADSLVGGFDFQMRTRVVFGEDTLDSLGALAGELGATRVLVVSDPGIVRAGHCERGIVALESAGADVKLFDGARENPTTEDVEAGVAVAKSFDPDLIVGLGGGSSMDCAKGINFLLTNGGRMKDYWGVGKASRVMLPMIAVPTTSGTGSELQSFALISDAQTHVKMACGDKKATCRVAVLDPKLTLTQPPTVTALTGIDAISHAVETYVTRPKNAISLTFSRQSWYLLCRHFPTVLGRPDDLEARAGVQLGASLAGLAIENSMLGGAHALANPLTAHFGTPHGQAVGLMLPHIVRSNAQAVDAAYDEMVELLPDSARRLGGTSSEILATWLESVLESAGLATRLSELGVDGAMLPTLARDADKQWTKGFNPRTLDEESLVQIYRDAL